MWLGVGFFWYLTIRFKSIIGHDSIKNRFTIHKYLIQYMLTLYKKCRIAKRINRATYWRVMGIPPPPPITLLHCDELPWFPCHGDGRKISDGCGVGCFHARCWSSWILSRSRLKHSLNHWHNAYKTNHYNPVIPSLVVCGQVCSPKRTHTSLPQHFCSSTYK